MSTSPDQDFVLKTIKSRDVHFVRFWFCDVLGHMKSFAVIPSELENAFEEGMGFDGSCIRGFASTSESDMLAYPEASTFQILPWRPERNAVGRMFCSIKTPEGDFFDGDSRNVLKRQAAKAERLGYVMNVGPELEYYYFKDPNGTEVLDHGGYFDLTSLDMASDLRRDTILTLEKMGIPVEYSHHENGPSQQEIDLRFADALARWLVEKGVRIYTHTRAYPSEADQAPGDIRTNRGTLHADTVVLATHYPFMDKSGLYFARIWQERSYVLALTRVPPMEHLYWAPGESGFSFRPASWTAGGGEVQGLLLGGKSHKTGHEGTRYHYEALRTAARSWYPDMRVAGRWSAQDGMTHDSVPYIGRYRQLDGKLAGRVFLATGFNKWGMTTSMAAADILSESILGRDHPCRDVFSPSRFDPGLKAKSFFIESSDMVGSLIGPYLHLPDATSASIRRGEGKVITVGGKRVGVYKDDQDVLHTVRPICPHMGCVLQWNRDERSWDCPCHGSRFDYTGRLLNDPAQRALETTPR